MQGYRQEEGVNPKSVDRDLRRAAHPHRQLALGRRAVSAALRQAPRASASPRSPCEFKQPPMHLFRAVDDASDEVVVARPKSNLLVLRIQPDEGISLSFACKRPGMQDPARRSAHGLLLRRAPSSSARRRPTSDCCSTRCAATPRCSRAPTRSTTPGGSSPPSTRAGRACRRRAFPNYYPVHRRARRGESATRGHAGPLAFTGRDVNRPPLREIVARDRNELAGHVAERISPVEGETP